MTSPLTSRPLGVAALLASLAWSACGARGTYECVNAEACDSRPDGVCEANGACSYPDGDCASGRRFGALAGPSSNECVEGADGGGEADGLTCGASGANLLSNAGFDEVDPAPWLVDSSAGQTLIYLDSDPALGGEVTADSAPRLAWLGGALAAVDSLVQPISVPAGAPGLVFGARYFITSAEPNQEPAFDVLAIALDDEEGDLLEDLGSLSNADAGGGWRSVVLPAAESHAGEIVRLRLEAHNDAGQLTNFFLDTVIVQVGECD